MSIRFAKFTATILILISATVNAQMVTIAVATRTTVG